MTPTLPSPLKGEGLGGDENANHLMLWAISKVMHYINGAYTNYVNRKKNRSGHLFQGRYKVIPVDQDSYLLELNRYIHMNPVRANIVNMPE